MNLSFTFVDMRPQVDMFANQPPYHALYNTNVHKPLGMASSYTKVLLFHIDGH